MLKVADLVARLPEAELAALYGAIPGGIRHLEAARVVVVRDAT